MVAGKGFRWWAVRVLAVQFTVDVAIRDDHQLIRSGPYHWLRHPSYTGSLATFHGFALALGSVWSLLLIAIVVTAAFLWRIRVEERALTTAFPQDYPAYARETKRLIPFVW
jgi:protein-S-isoprenylcysteine O-methyltransferase